MRFQTTALLLLTLVALFGCQQPSPQQAQPAAESAETSVTSTASATDTVAVMAKFPCKELEYPKTVEVYVGYDEKGKNVIVAPEDVYLYCDDQDIVWKTDRDAVEITFEQDKLPPPDCQGKECKKNYKGNPNGKYKYKAVVKVGNDKYPKDPHVIIQY